jgi:hypothetical protein
LPHPIFLLILTGGSLLSVTVMEALHWLRFQSIREGWMPPEVTLAILGGFTWVLNNHFEKMNREDFRPIDPLWSCFRLLIAVPSAYAFSVVLQPTWSMPMAYLLGTLPTGTIMMIGRRLLARVLPTQDAPQVAPAPNPPPAPNAAPVPNQASIPTVGDQAPIQILADVDTRMAERLIDEGITTCSQLAYTDPIKLSIRTGLNFTVTLGLASDAMLGMYLMRRDYLEIFRLNGLCGAYECASLWKDIISGTNTEREKATAIINKLAEKLSITTEGIENLLRELTEDPYTQFYLEVWATNMD